MAFPGLRYLLLLLLFFFAGSLLPDEARAARAIDDSDIRSPCAVIIDQKTGRIFFEKNAHEKRPIASITKIMTAILAIESGKLDEWAPVNGRAVHTEGSSIYLKEGEKVRLIDLVYGLMLRSGNDAAVAIAEHVGGSVEGFVYMMNEKAALLGMADTHFANPHGLDEKNHYSTAYDMALLMKYAMENETFRKISGTKVYLAESRGKEAYRVFRNKNRLLTELYPNATGGKTGYTKQAKRTLVSSAEKNGLDLIAVTLNSPSQDDWQDHITLYERVFDSYRMTNILPEGTIKAVRLPFYKNRVYLAEGFAYPLAKEERRSVSVRYRMLKPKREWGKRGGDAPPIVGKAEIYLNGEKIRTMPIYLKAKKDEGNFFQRFQRIFARIAGVSGHD